MKKSVKKLTKTAMPAIVVTGGLVQVPSRSALMAEVQRRGIKNFRVMNKKELRAIVDGATAPQIEAIQIAAVSRWKSGWKKNKEVAS